ncbi:mucin-6-like [Arctopsyche grandis]|uniref:mucin-6-like n=1 Tax=Arctopsyche grandis TaxID=121162 RepID=UPI00406D77A3
MFSVRQKLYFHVTPICSGKNEIFSYCGNDGCQPSCTRVNVTGCNPICSIPACICKPSFVRDHEEKCVSPTMCHCSGQNEIFSICGNDGCQPTCRVRDVTGCVPNCKSRACICAPGHVRNDAGICVKPNSCPCRKSNEIYSACGDNGCQPTCSRIDVSSCVPICSTPKCICQPGYVRDALGKCIEPSLCRK